MKIQTFPLPGMLYSCVNFEWNPIQSQTNLILLVVHTFHEENIDNYKISSRIKPLRAEIDN